MTHLVANKPEGAKYKHAKIWGLHVVSVEWLQDSLERGMILDEKLFNPEWQVEERGKDAWNRVKPSLLGKRSRDDSTATFDEGRRKLRRTASTKLSSQNEKIWGDIFKGNNSIQAANSGEREAMPEKLPQQQPTIAIAQAQSLSDPCTLHYETAPSLLGGTFSGCQFYIHGFDRRKAPLLEEHLLSHAAEISATLDNLVSTQSQNLYVVVPHLTCASELPEVPESARHIKLVTEWWVECCIGAKTLVDPTDYALGRPFPKFPLHRFNELTICSTGFEGLQLLHLVKVVGIMGAKYEEIFSKDVSVLICNSARNIRREKLLLAHEWKLPTVSLDWLLDTIRKGERQLFSPYIQRIKQTKSEYKDISSIDEQVGSKKMLDAGGVKGGVPRPTTMEVTRPAKASKLDPTAFQEDMPVKIKVEEPFLPAASPPLVQALAEICSNSPRKKDSPSKKPRSFEPLIAPTTLPEAINTAMTSILSKSKSVLSHAHVDQAESQEGVRKKRAPARILGRAASNISTASATTTGASSVDSTSSTGQAIVWPSNKCGSGERRSSHALRADLKQDAALMALTTDLEAAADKHDSPPPQTQMQYEDPESMEYQAQLMARITGEKLVRKEKERVATIASLDAGMGEASRMRKGRSLRERQGGGLR